MDHLGTDFWLGFFVALGLGALVGLEREHRRDETHVIAGVRTFPLFSLSGYMVGVLSIATETYVITAAGVLVIGATALAFLFVRHRLGIHGLTTPMAMVVTFLVGTLVAYGLVQEAVVIGVATTFLLLTKGRLHQFADKLSDDEMMSALQFITIVFILFPLTRSLTGPLFGIPWIGPGRIVDPHQILMVVVFVSALSFASFIAMRTVGTRRGLEVSGLLGGLVNSEAATVSLAHRAKQHEALVGVATVGILLATGAMFARNVVILAFAAREQAVAVLPLVLPVAVAGLAAAALAALLLRPHAKREARDVGRLEVRNPFAISEALKFALVFAVLAALVAILRQFLGPQGVYFAALGGFAYAGAVVASLGTLVAYGQVDAATAALTAGLAMLAGAANKWIILHHANRDVLKRVWLPVAAIVVAGGVALAATFLLV